MTSMADQSLLDIEIGVPEYEDKFGVRLSIKHKDIHDSLKCYICWDILSPPVRQCINGHCVCCTCFRSIHECGTCRQLIIRARCSTVEALLKNVWIICLYNANGSGCSAALSSDAVTTHEESCSFRHVMRNLQETLHESAIDLQNQDDLETRLLVNRIGIERTLECYGCRNILTRPIRQCLNGHCICWSCFKLMYRCGLCNQPYLTARCLTIEALLENASITCIYKDEGCSSMLTADTVRMHEESCSFRTVKCNLNEGHNASIEFNDETRLLVCQNEDDKSQSFRIQFYERRSFRIQFYDNDILNAPEGPWPLVYCAFDDQMFLVRNSIHEKQFTTWVTFVGDEFEAEEYQVTMTLESLSMDDGLKQVLKDVRMLSSHLGSQIGPGEARHVCKPVSELQRNFSGNFRHPTTGAMHSYSWCVFYEFSKVN